VWSELRNEARLALVVEAAGPLVVRDARPSGIDPVLPDMAFVRDAAGQPYLPGSSLKGVFRSRAERLLRGLEGDAGACDPFGDASCGRRLERSGSDAARRGEARYRASCYACRMFGSTALRGRVAFADASVVPEVPLVLGERHHVAIDRVTGGPAGGRLFQPETVEAGAFRMEARLTNFALWQLWMLVAVLRDLDAGFVGIGGGTTRGYGRVRIVPDSVRLRWRTLRQPASGELVGYLAEDRARDPTGAAFVRTALGFEATWQGWDALTALADADPLEEALRRDLPSAASGGGRR
jgi:CRISPR-associated protein Csm3